MAKYFSARVHDNADPDQRARLTLEVPGLLGEDGIWPDWIEPRIVPGAGPNASGLVWIPPVDALVVVELDDEGPSPRLRWLGSELGNVNTLPAFLAGNYPGRAGFTSPTGSGTVAIDDDAGVFAVVDDEASPAGLQHLLHLGRRGAFQVGLAPGGSILFDASGFAVVSSGGHLLQLDDDTPQIAIVHKDGVELITLGGGVTKINGTAIQISGGAIEWSTGVTPPLDPYLLSLALLGAISGLASEIAAVGAGIPAGLAIPTPNAIQWPIDVATSLATGAPFLSTLIKGQ